MRGGLVAKLLDLLAGGFGLEQRVVDYGGEGARAGQSLRGKSGGVKGAVIELKIAGRD